jgi:hypothetical protein
MEYDFEFNTQLMHLPCGGTAHFDTASGIGYRCEVCMAVVGSMGQPNECKEEMKKWENWAKLGGQDWLYFKGQPQ